MYGKNHVGKKNFNFSVKCAIITIIKLKKKKAIFVHRFIKKNVVLSIAVEKIHFVPNYCLFLKIRHFQKKYLGLYNYRFLKNWRRK